MTAPSSIGSRLASSVEKAKFGRSHMRAKALTSVTVIVTVAVLYVCVCVCVCGGGGGGGGGGGKKKSCTSITAEKFQAIHDQLVTASAP